MSKVRRKKCKECKEFFIPNYSSVQMVCSPKCAISYSNKKNKETKENNKKELDQLFIEKKQRETLTTLIKSVSTTCHLYIRLRDKNKPCISCGTPYKKDFDAGHYYPGGKFSSLKFNENNIHGQCIKCNRFNEGNEINYRLYLPERIGLESLDELDYLASLEKKQSFKWNREELIKIRNYYKQKIKEL